MRRTFKTLSITMGQPWRRNFPRAAHPYEIQGASVPSNLFLNCEYIVGRRRSLLMPNPRTWKLTLAYDGTDYFGWQVQPRRPTVQGALAEAIEHIIGECSLPQGSGRTDAGVHALAQVASCELRATIPAENFLRALNRALPAAIRVNQAELVARDFHARHSAVRKTYEYRIFRGEICPPLLGRFCHALHWPLDLEKLNAAARQIIGGHDFTSFAAVDPELQQREQGTEAPNPAKTIFCSGWQEQGELLLYRVTGSGFLHHMVRNLVGTMIDIGRGHLPPDAMERILEARDRTAAGPTAPARGLFLHSVEYEQVAR